MTRLNQILIFSNSTWISTAVSVGPREADNVSAVKPSEANPPASGSVAGVLPPVTTVLGSSAVSPPGLWASGQAVRIEPQGGEADPPQEKVSRVILVKKRNVKHELRKIV